MGEGGGRTGRLVPTSLVALTLFLCMADRVFSTPVGGLNLRWGQLLLFAGALVGAWRAARGLRSGDLRLRGLLPIAAAFGLFFAAYAASALSSPSRLPSLVKLGWGVFNVGGAMLVCLVAAPDRRALRDGFLAAVGALAGVVWVDALAMYWFGASHPLLGLAQRCYLYEGQAWLRPHAFYYEPSYAGAALAFAALLVVAATWSMRPALRLVLPALVVGATALVAARTGLLALVVAFGAAGVVAILRREFAVLRRLFAVGGLGLLMLLVFFLPPRARGYADLIAGPLGPTAIAARLHSRLPPPGEKTVADEVLPPEMQQAQLDLETRFHLRVPPTSEGRRVLSAWAAALRWRAHPLLGAGARRRPAGQGFLLPSTMNTWLELLVESGLVGLVLFALAVGLAVRMTLRRAEPLLVPLFAGAFVGHFLVNLNFTQTFPRLDYWLFFFAAMRLALPETQPAPAPSLAPAAAAAPTSGPLEA